VRDSVRVMPADAVKASGAWLSSPSRRENGHPIPIMQDRLEALTELDVSSVDQRIDVSEDFAVHAEKALPDRRMFLGKAGNRGGHVGTVGKHQRTVVISQLTLEGEGNLDVNLHSVLVRRLEMALCSEMSS